MKRLFVATIPLLLLCASQAAPTKSKPTGKPKANNKAKPKPAQKPKATSKPKVTPRPAAPTATPIAAGPKTWALLVGVSQYQSEQISGLRFPATDASGLRDALMDPKVGGLPAQQILLLTDADATRDKINGAVRSFLRPNVQSGDKVVVFLAGHGITKGVGLNAKGFLLPTDAKGLTSTALETSAVSLRSLADDLASLPASQFVVFVDACREDPTPGRGVKGNSLSDVLARGISVVPQNENAQSATFFACSVGQRAFEDTKYGHGVFTNWILEGLRQGAIAQQSDGAVDMGRLSSYVENKVEGWAKETSASGNFEVSQTPELVATRLSEPLVLLRVKRAVVDAPITASAPRVSIAASPDTAQISINGDQVGVGSVEKSLPAEGDYSVSISATGYTSAARTVKAWGGYEQQILVQLQPATSGGGVPTATDERVNEFYRRALDAQEREQYEIAEQGYNAAITADPKISPAYVALANLHRLQSRNVDVIADALKMVANTPRNAHSLSLLSRAYNEFTLKGEGQDNITKTLSAFDGYGMPKDSGDSAKLALRSANEAVALDANSPEANLAQGYALAALDTKGKNKRAALAAFGKAAFVDASDADNQLGLGYGIRFYGLQLKNEEEKQAELRRAINTLNEAVKLRPNFYEAHRELAFCLIALGDNAAAMTECKLARSNRGGASDPNEIAGVEVAMAGLHEKIAQNSTGDKKAANEAASQGYLADAKETAPDANLEKAGFILGAAGVSTALGSYLPAQLRPLLDIRGSLEGKLREKIPFGGIFGR